MGYSQGSEEEVILKYFGDFKGVFLSIGENNGIDLSNVRQLAVDGWSGVCVEPSTVAFSKLEDLYAGSKYVSVHNIAIGTEDSEMDFYESDEHLGRGDYALLSTIVPKEMNRWGNTQKFTKTKCLCLTYNTFIQNSSVKKFDFISIDAEGMDYEILTQIDLSETKMVCVEFNQKGKDKYVGYCRKYGLELVFENYENLIFAR